MLTCLAEQLLYSLSVTPVTCCEVSHIRLEWPRKKVIPEPTRPRTWDSEQNEQPASILKGSDDGVMHFEESYPSSNVFSLKTTFLKLALFPSSGKRGGAPTLWGPLERASFNHWTYLKMEAEPVSETLFLKKKHWTMDKIRKQDSSKWTAARLRTSSQGRYLLAIFKEGVSSFAR
jgi:hypothetical protein